MRLIQLFWVSCLLLILVSPVSVYAAQPSDQVYGPVAPKETLSEIAQRVRGEWRIPLKYAVQAMHELNPHAFSGGIGTLHLGSMLVIPDMAALIEEVPELLPNKPKPPTSKRPIASTPPPPTPTPVPAPAPAKPSASRQLSKPDSQQIDALQLLVQEQLIQAESHAETLIKLMNQTSASHELTKGLQKKLSRLQQQQQISNQRLQELETQIQAARASDPTKQNFPFGLGQLEFYILLIAIPTLLALIAIFMARRPVEPVEILIPETPTTPTPHTEAVFQPEAVPSEPSEPDEPDEPQDHDLTTDTVITQPEATLEPEEVESPVVDEAELTIAKDNVTGNSSQVEDIPEEELYDKGESTAPLDDQEKTPETPETETSTPIDISEGFMTLDEANELEKTGDIATVDIDDLDDFQKLKTAEDEIEAKLSFAYLHIDMGDPQQAGKTLAEIDLATYPKFTDKVNEIRALISKSEEIPEVTEPELTTLDEPTKEQPEEPTTEFEIDIPDETPEADNLAIEKTEPVQQAANSTQTNLDEPTKEQPEEPTTEFELDIPDESPEAGSLTIEETEPVQPVAKSGQTNSTEEKPSQADKETSTPKLTALEKVLTQQLKLANTYNNQGKLDKSKSYIAKILRNGTPDYRQKALTLLQDIEFKELAAKEKQQMELNSPDAEQTVIMQSKDKSSPASKTQSGDLLLITGISEIIPKNLSDRFKAYSEDEDGTKLTLAYLFLDLDEVDTATQLLEEVLESGDRELVKEAEELLEQLVVF